MPQKTSKTPQKVPKSQVRRPDTSQFDTVEGLMSVAGVGRLALRRLIVKEVVDNALDEMDGLDEEDRLLVGADPVTVSKDGDDTYIVTDEGSGFAQDRDKLCDLFFAYRDMATGKFLRKPSRGVLGNGLRVLAAAVALSEGTIIVESHGQRTTLRPRRMGLPTEVVAQTASRRKRGSRITFTLDAAIIPSDSYDLVYGELAIALADHGEPPYKRLPSPHWLDLDHLVQGFHFIDPHDMTVRQWIEGLDGCTGAKAGHIARPFGKNCTCASLKEAQIAALLKSMQESARVVKPTALGPIGATAFGEEYDGYKIAEAWLSGIGAHQPHANIPVLIEAWASVTTLQQGGARLIIFCNRTRVVSRVDAGRGRDHIWIHGAELEGTIMVPGGDCSLVVAVTSPHIPTVSSGKAPDLSGLQEEIVEVLRKAFTQSRNIRKNSDPAQPKPPKGEPKPKKPKREPYQPSGPLAKFLASEAEKAGVSPRDLLVLSRDHDPFDETKRLWQLAEWFKKQVEDLKPEGEVHLRGMYYRCLSARVLLPDGADFEGTEATTKLVELAGKYARFCGLVPFERIIDERAAPPEPYVYDEEHDDASADPINRELVVSDTREPYERKPLAVPELDRLLPALSISAPPTPRQPYRISMIGEKTSLGEVLRPIAKEVRGELVLGTGEISDAMVHGIASRAAKDGRPLLVLYFCDFDPSGWQMLISVSRKLQALIKLNPEFASLKVRVIHVGLTFAQVKEYGLPDAPIKKTEKRKSAWLKKWWPEKVEAAKAKLRAQGKNEDDWKVEGGQVEIDALAALRPEVLDQITRDAIAPYFDFDYERRYNEATEMPEEHGDWFLDQPAYRKAKAAISKAHKRAAAAMAALAAAQEEAIESMRDVVANEAPELAEFIVEPEIDWPDDEEEAVQPGDEPDEVVFNSKYDFVGATEKLQYIKAYCPDEDQAEEKDEDQDEDEGEDEGEDQDEEDADEDTEEEEEDESM